MPELMDGAYLFGIAAAVLSWVLGRRSETRWRIPLWGCALIGAAAAIAGPPVFAVVQQAWRASPFLPDVTPGMAFIGLWAGLAALTLFERKGQPRRVPIWAGLLVAIVAAFGVPPLIDRASGSYQEASLRTDVNRCTTGMLGEVQPRRVTNVCDFPITVGLCMPGELNPAPCLQSVTLAPGATASFDPGEARVSYAPGNRDGLTVVACRPPNRPSRRLGVHGKSHDGVCLPKA
ncbi:MAG: hypothetical protein GC146_01280 [Limimaricola sp.]|uniref:hypothetical protein n=1 Tax=Limimaricola sp. TaxID=2211665 RepID=UPI001D436107|nr:hypothetical protein [Limimaricola sp.]MBI1415831.1 hypothetical protein [Limimaricola sp.]